ncbi:MAG: Crp/Fnr family transcriptional regulator [Prochlorococcaceae cyanobacterium]
MLLSMPDRCLQLSLGAGQPVPATVSWRLDAGYLRASSWTDQAEIFTVGIWGPGESVIPELLTMQPVELHALSSVHVSEWLPGPDERQSFSATHIQQMSMLLRLSRIRPADVRLFHLLMWLGHRFGHVTPKGVIVPLEEMNITHRQMAEIASMSRVTVTKTLGQFRQQGWLIKEGSSDLVARSAIALFQRPS